MTVAVCGRRQPLIENHVQKTIIHAKKKNVIHVIKIFQALPLLRFCAFNFARGGGEPGSRLNADRPIPIVLCTKE